MGLDLEKRKTKNVVRGRKHEVPMNETGVGPYTRPGQSAGRRQTRTTQREKKERKQSSNAHFQKTNPSSYTRLRKSTGKTTNKDRTKSKIGKQSSYASLKKNKTKFIHQTRKKYRKTTNKPCPKVKKENKAAMCVRQNQAKRRWEVCLRQGGECRKHHVAPHYVGKKPSRLYTISSLSLCWVSIRYEQSQTDWTVEKYMFTHVETTMASLPSCKENVYLNAVCVLSSL